MIPKFNILALTKILIFDIKFGFLPSARLWKNLLVSVLSCIFCDAFKPGLYQRYKFLGIKIFKKYEKRRRKTEKTLRKGTIRTIKPGAVIENADSSSGEEDERVSVSFIQTIFDSTVVWQRLTDCCLDQGRNFPIFYI